MRSTLICASAVAIVLVFAAAAAGSNPGFKRYTFPAAPPAAVAPTGGMTVLLPAEWKVKTAWGDTALRGPSPSAVDPIHTTVHWWVDAWLAPAGTTLDEMRQQMLGWTGRPVWGKGTPINRLVGDTYLTLPIGKVWRLTTSPGNGYVTRIYVIDRGVVLQRHGGSRQELFTQFWVNCRGRQCQAHNEQLSTVMRSIRITPTRS